MRQLRFSIRSISFREAFLFAILLHIILFIAIKIDPVTILPAGAKTLADARQNQEPIKFNFVDVPNDRSSPVRPDTNRFSDKNRLAGDSAPENIPESEDRLPYSVGNTKEFTAGTPPPAAKSESREPSPDTEKESPGKDQAPLSSEPLSGDRLLARPLKEVKPDIGKPSSALSRESLKDSLMNLERYIDSGTYDSSDSGLGTDSFLSFDTKDFDFGPYAELLYRIVKSNWIIPYAASPMGLKGVTIVSFRIQKDGRVTNLTLEKSSDIRPFDGAALNAIGHSNPLPHLPRNFPEDSVGVRFGFFYNVVPPDK